MQERLEGLLRGHPGFPNPVEIIPQPAQVFPVKLERLGGIFPGNLGGAVATFVPDGV